MSVFLRKYNTAATIDGVVLIEKSTGNFKSSPTLASGDVKVSKDGGAFANPTSLPTVTPASGTSVQITLTSTEMQAARVVVRFIDQSDPKEWEDQEVIIETFGNASATLAVDFSDAVRFGLTALPDADAESAGGLLTLGSGPGQISQTANGTIEVNNVLGGVGDLATAPGIPVTSAASGLLEASALIGAAPDNALNGLTLKITSATPARNGQYAIITGYESSSGGMTVHCSANDDGSWATTPTSADTFSLLGVGPVRLAAIRHSSASIDTIHNIDNLFTSEIPIDSTTNTSLTSSVLANTSGANALVGSWIMIESVTTTRNGQTALITGFNNTTGVFTTWSPSGTNGAWASNPTSADSFALMVVPPAMLAGVTHTGATIPTVTTTGTATNVTNDVGITQTGADKVWDTAARTITGGDVDNVATVVNLNGFTISGLPVTSSTNTSLTSSPFIEAVSASAYIGGWITIQSGAATRDKQSALVTGFDRATGVFTTWSPNGTNGAWASNPTSADTFGLMNAPPAMLAGITHTGATIPTVTTTATATALGATALNDVSDAVDAVMASLNLDVLAASAAASLGAAVHADSILGRLAAKSATTSFDRTTDSLEGLQDSDVYYAQVNLTVDGSNSQDEYTVVWYKNGVRVSSGTGSASLLVLRRSTGATLITQTMTQIASTGVWKYDAVGGERLTAGEAGLAVVSWTIDGSSRESTVVVGRDS